MRKNLFVALLLVLSLVISAQAESLDAIFKRVNDLVAAKNYSKAIQELTWANKEIEKMHLAQLQGFFPDKLTGFAGEKLNFNSAMGFTNIERNYKKGASSIKVSLTGGTGAAGQGFGQMAAIGQMAAAMGGAQGSGNETIRVAGRTAIVEIEEGATDGAMTVILESGSILKFEMEGGVSKAALEAAANEIKIEELDKYLKG